MRNRPVPKPVLRAQPISDAARNGCTQILTDGTTFAVGRWDGTTWIYPLCRRPSRSSPRRFTCDRRYAPADRRPRPFPHPRNDAQR
jgi:hypothetical protein